MSIKQTGLVILVAALALSACGKQGEDGATGAQTPAIVESQPAATPPAPAAPVVTTSKPAGASVEPTKPSVNLNIAPLSKDEALVLAQASGCLACHKIEAKLVGPAWQDVSAKYKGDGDAKTRLVAKVKAGGKGNWTELTGGMPMPPYSPRVSDENIEKLVTFVLSL